jgi:hypothetical protein
LLSFVSGCPSPAKRGTRMNPHPETSKRCGVRVARTNLRVHCWIGNWVQDPPPLAGENSRSIAPQKYLRELPHDKQKIYLSEK